MKTDLKKITSHPIWPRVLAANPPASGYRRNRIPAARGAHNIIQAVLAAKSLHVAGPVTHTIPLSVTHVRSDGCSWQATSGIWVRPGSETRPVWVSRSQRWSQARRDERRATARPDSDFAKNLRAGQARDRKNLHARLRAEAVRINTQPTTLAGISAFVATSLARQARLNEIGRILGKPYAAEKYSGLARELTGSKIPTTGAEARKLGLSLTSGVSWDITAGLTSRVLADQNCESEKKNGKWRTVCNADHRATFRSFGLIDAKNPRNLMVAFGDREFSVELPENSRWEIDPNGIKAVFGPDDFHPDINILLEKDAPDKIMSYIETNAETRRQHAAQAAAEVADMEGVWVCVADSRRAGNCVAGTISFATRHGLDPARHYRATEIIAQANGDTGRAKLAIRAAINRHNEECARGFSNLADHQIAA